jgi:hypothetical protein
MWLHLPVADMGISAVVVSVVKVFNADELKEKSGANLSMALKNIVNAERKFDFQRIEILTKGKYHFNFSGKIDSPIPAFDEIIPQVDFENRLKSSESVEHFNFHASIKLSITYPFIDFENYLDGAEDEGVENPNFFSWVEYCRDDALETLTETLKNESDLIPFLTIQGM